MAMEYAREEIAKQFGVAESESDNLQIDKKPPELTFSVNDESDNFAELIASPLPKGMGETLGNAIRRTLLNSLPGSAITWVRIDGVQHEYSSIDGVKEGVIELLLNFKKIRLKAMSERSGRMRLDVKGEGEVAFANLIAEIIRADMKKSNLKNEMPSVHYITSNGEARITTSVERIKDLTEIPSPYLGGKLDEFFDGKLQPVIPVSYTHLRAHET